MNMNETLSENIIVEVITASEMKSIQEVTNIMQLPRDIRLPLSVQTDSEIGRRLGLTDTAVSGFYNLKIEVYSSTKLALSYVYKMHKHYTTLLKHEIIYEPNDYDGVLRRVVDNILDELDLVRADFTDAREYLQFTFNQCSSAEESPGFILLT